MLPSHLIRRFLIRCRTPQMTLNCISPNESMPSSPNCWCLRVMIDEWRWNASSIPLWQRRRCQCNPQLFSSVEKASEAKTWELINAHHFDASSWLLATMLGWASYFFSSFFAVVWRFWWPPTVKSQMLDFRTECLSSSSPKTSKDCNRPFLPDDLFLVWNRWRSCRRLGWLSASRSRLH